MTQIKLNIPLIKITIYKAEILLLETPSVLFQRASFSEKMIIGYTKRPECKAFKKNLLKNPQLAIQKETEELIIMPEKIYEKLKASREFQRPSKATPLSGSLLSDESRRTTVHRQNQMSASLRPFSDNSMTDVSYDGFRKNSTVYYVNLFKDHDNCDENDKSDESGGEESKSVMNSFISSSLTKNLDILNEKSIYIFTKLKSSF